MIVLQILMALVSIVLIASVIMQDGDSDGIAALGLVIEDTAAGTRVKLAE